MRFSLILGVGALGLVAMACEKPQDSAELAASDNSALSTTAQCVKQATNDELLTELQARLAAGSSSGSTSTVSSLASFSCDSTGHLSISVVAPNGQESSQSVYTGDVTRCNATAATLNQSRQHITQTSLVAACDSTAHLYRYSITPAGVVTALAQQYIGDVNACETQAAAINR